MERAAAFMSVLSRSIKLSSVTRITFPRKRLQSTSSFLNSRIQVVTCFKRKEQVQEVQVDRIEKANSFS